MDIAALLKGSDSNESSVSPPQHTRSTSVPPTTATIAPPGGFPAPPYAAFAPVSASAASSPRIGGGGISRATVAGGFNFGLAGQIPGPTAHGAVGVPGVAAAAALLGPAGRRAMPHTSDSPAKKQSKWSPEEDALIIELRGSGMKWDDISKRLPGRSAISCRLHYQNYLERRSEWDEERKNKLARLYER